MATAIQERQRASALQTAQVRKVEGARQRDALVGQSMRVVVGALVHPSDELASMRLGLLFGPRGGNRRGSIPGVGMTTVRRVLNEFYERADGTLWHTELRLRDLDDGERRQLVRALVARASADWRAAP